MVFFSKQFILYNKKYLLLGKEFAVVALMLTSTIGINFIPCQEKQSHVIQKQRNEQIP